MSHGTKTWPRTCPYCGEIYIHSNLGNRRRKYGWNYDAGTWENVHLVTCKARDKKPSWIPGWRSER